MFIRFMSYNDAYTLQLALTSHQRLFPHIFPSLRHVQKIKTCRKKVKGGVLVEWLTRNSSPRVLYLFSFSFRSSSLVEKHKADRMFKVFRIKEEHSACGIGSRGLARVRPNHSSLFLAISHCLSFSLPLFSLSCCCLPLHVYWISQCLFYTSSCVVLNCSLCRLLFYITVLPVIFLLYRPVLQLFLPPLLHLSFLYPSLSLSIMLSSMQFSSSL